MSDAETTKGCEAQGKLVSIKELTAPMVHDEDWPGFGTIRRNAQFAWDHDMRLHAEIAALRADTEEVARGRHKFPGGPDHNYFTGFPGKNCPLCDLIESRRLRALKEGEP